MDKGSGSGFFPDQDTDDPKRPDQEPDPQQGLKGKRIRKFTFFLRKGVILFQNLLFIVFKLWTECIDKVIKLLIKR